jgi:hypothetical protein
MHAVAVLLTLLLPFLVCALHCAEDEPLPGDWKRMPEFDRLLLFRALRPDRLTAAMKKFVTNMIGSKYVTSQPYDLERSFQDSAPGTPIFVFLSPGVDVVSVVCLQDRLRRRVLVSMPAEA